MSRVDWRHVFVGSMMGVIVSGCALDHALSDSQGIEHPGDPTARSFRGTIISLRPTTSTMLISKDERKEPGTSRDAFPNIVSVRYDAQTQFYLDDHPATLDQLQQYMNVSINGHMRDGQLVAEAAHFSSVLPANVRPAAAQAKN